MRTAVHDNSLAAYRSEEPRLSRRASAVLADIIKRGPGTDREIAARMGFDHRSAVQPRITELIDANALMEVASRRCPVTGKTVRVVDIRKARQEALFS